MIARSTRTSLCHSARLLYAVPRDTCSTFAHNHTPSLFISNRMGAGASVQLVAPPLEGPVSSYMEDTESKEVRQPQFCYEESCLFPENPRYAVDMSGNILDTNRGVLLKQSFRKKGYLAVSMRDVAAKKTTRWNVHKVVAITFCERPEGCDQVDHIDRNSTNNHASNLRWCTVPQSLRNRGRLPNSGMPRGVRRENPGYEKFMVQIRHNKKYYYLFGFDSIPDAEVASKKLRLELHGEFAVDV